MLEESPHRTSIESKVALLMLVLATCAFLIYFMSGGPADKGDRHAVDSPARRASKIP
jgi:hypothetical protein